MTNIAYLLKIDKERIRVVDVIAGSVHVDMEIGPELCEDKMVSGNESDVDCGVIALQNVEPAGRQSLRL